MTKEQVKEAVEKLICDKQGIKAVTLASDPEIYKVLDNECFLDIMEELVKEGRVVEIEYSIPSMSYRVKSFYLPGGSVVGVRGTK